jgi:hypothetical protein
MVAAVTVRFLSKTPRYGLGVGLFWLTLLLMLGCSVFLLAHARRTVLIAQAAIFLWGAAYLTWYVASEDDYRRGGISRWDAYDAHVVTVAAIAACFAVAAGALAAQRWRRIVPAAAGVAGLAVLGLFAAAVLANSLN